MSDAKLYLFDFDGTIVDSLDAAVEAFNTVGPALGCKRVDPEKLAVILEGKAEDVMREYGFQPWKLPLIVLGVRARLRRQLSTLKPFHEVIGVMRQLRTRGRKVGIITSNSRKNVRSFLLAQGAHDCVDFIDSSLHIFGKDTALRRAVAKAGIPAKRTVYVGDEVRDIQAAHRAGIRAAAVTWGFQSKFKLQQEGPDFLIESAKELYSL